MSLATRLVAPFVVLALAACSDPLPTPGGGTPPPGRPSLPEAYRPSGHMALGDVMVHLFEWTWTDIASECEIVLGPAGFHAVQVSPPQEHSLTPSRDWSERYQPVSYSIARSRSGTGAEFEDMVNRCRAVGVGIIVDAVINHMTNFPSPGTGSAGTPYSKYDYPGPPLLYTQVDFHAPCAITNYQSAANVQDCELFSLPDLNTGSASVRRKIADYLLMLARLGVEGFRIDAAKHIQQVELDSIIILVNTTLAGEGRPLPYFYLEVIAGGGEAIGERDYYGEGYSSGGAADITEFTFVGVGDKFRPAPGQYAAQLNPTGMPGNQFSETAWGIMPSDKAVVFLQNHDTQHTCDNISYRNGAAFRLANVWMLAQPYGYPSILSSYAFSCGAGNSMGPISDGDGWTLPVSCVTDWTAWASATPGQWLCEHRDPYIRAMVGFRRAVAGTAVANWWDNDLNAIAFSRGAVGFVAINREATTLSQTVTTGLPAGTYCDRLTGGRVNGSCAGTALVVDAAGAVQLSLAPLTAIAIDSTTRN
jgi:alpha-amylase